MTSETSSLGEFLRHERERRGITIEQVASATKIGVRTLHSLEGDHYAELPAKPFIRGFVISYCRFIGLDAKEVLATYSDFMLQKASERPNREGGHSGYAFEKRDGEQQSRTLLFIAIFGFVVIGGVAVLVLKPSFHHHKNSHIDKLRAAHNSETDKNSTEIQPKAAGGATPLVSTLPAGIPVGGLSEDLPGGAAAHPSLAPSNEGAAPQPTAVPSAIPAVASLAAPATPTAEKPGEVDSEKPGADSEDPLDSGHKLRPEETHHRVMFKIKEDVWVRYQVDGRPARKFIIRGGKSLYLKATDKITFQVSNPELVSFSYNNRSFAQVNESKDVVERQGAATLFFPIELTDRVQTPFKDTKPLPKAVPKPSASQAAPQASSNGT